MPRQMPRLSRGWPSRPPCPRPASQGARPVRVTPAPPARAALKMTSCHMSDHTLLLASRAEDRQRDRTEGAKQACERLGGVAGCHVARDWEWHGAARLKGASMSLRGALQ